MIVVEFTSNSHRSPGPSDRYLVVDTDDHEIALKAAAKVLYEEEVPPSYKDGEDHYTFEDFLEAIESSDCFGVVDTHDATLVKV